MFAQLSEADLEWLAARLTTRNVPAGVDLIVAGAPGEGVYFILSGVAKVYMPQLNGSEVTVKLIGPGETVGELAAIDRGERSASVVALEDITALRMNQSDFDEALTRIPGLARQLLRLLSNRVRRNTEAIQSLASLDVSGRVAHQLLDLVNSYGRVGPEGVSLPLRLTQDDIAELVGASRRRVNQFMAELRRAGVIKVDSHGRLVVCDRDALRTLLPGQ